MRPVCRVASGRERGPLNSARGSWRPNQASSAGATSDGASSRNQVRLQYACAGKRFTHWSGGSGAPGPMLRVRQARTQQAKDARGTIQREPGPDARPAIGAARVWAGGMAPMLLGARTLAALPQNTGASVPVGNLQDGPQAPAHSRPRSAPVVGAHQIDEEPMSRAAFSARVFAVYVMATGAVFVVAPNALLSLFGVPPTTEVWAHVVGVLACMIGIYAWVGGRHDHRPFLVASVGTRVLVFAAFTTFVLLGMAPPVLALFGAVDLAGALWTYLALRADAKEVDARGVVRPQAA
jgi:hypothetical protein